jgi:hypothetical protein
MNIIAAVYHSLKRKKSAEAESQRLGISISYYQKIKEEVIKVLNDAGSRIDSVIIQMVEANLTKKSESISNEEILFELEQQLGVDAKDRFHNRDEDSKRIEIHEDLESGTSKIVGLSATEPRSAEEIISLLKIDTKIWKLSQYWNKEKGTKWLVSALVSRVPQEEKIQSTFLELLETYQIPQITPLDPAAFWQNTSSKEKVCGVLSLQDLHFGKVGNEDMAEILRASVSYLIEKAHTNYVLEKIVFVIGPDTLNMDTFGGTTTKGTPVENSEMATEAYIKAFDGICQAIGIAKQFCEKLEVLFIPGNHDRLSSFHLLHAVSQAFKSWEDIEFNVTYAERKVVTYGLNMLCFEHGDVTAKNNPLVYAVEFASEWGFSKYRMLYTGHYHGRKTTQFVTENEQNGFVTRIIPALTSSDYYHYHNKYVGNSRSAIIHIHDSSKGLISEFTYTV